MKRNFEILTIASSEYSTVKKLWFDYTEQSDFVDNRQRKNIIVKHSFAVAVKKLTSMSLSDIGSIIDKDHATVIHANKKHDENMMYLGGYKETFNLFFRELRKLLEISIIESEADDIDDNKELRNRLIDTSSRLRLQIIENKKLKKQMETSPARAVEENKILSKMLKEVRQRNDKLNAELIRIKNLL
jgi:hypothetical protein